MVCNPGDPCYHSLEGKVITGRSTAGHDVRVPFNDYYSRQRAVSYNHTMGPPTMGVPLTEEERMQRHYEIYGTTDLPPRGTGALQNAGKLEGIDWGLFFWGGVAGVVVGYFLFAATGRKIAYKAGERVARRV